VIRHGLASRHDEREAARPRSSLRRSIGRPTTNAPSYCRPSARGINDCRSLDTVSICRNLTLCDGQLAAGNGGATCGKRVISRSFHRAIHSKPSNLAQMRNRPDTQLSLGSHPRELLLRRMATQFCCTAPPSENAQQVGCWRSCVPR